MRNRYYVVDSCAKKYLVESNQVGKLGNVGFETTISTLVLTKRKYKREKPLERVRNQRRLV